MSEIADDLADDALEEVATDPLRRCIATGVRLRRETMLRFVMAPDAALVFDVASTLPGRGIWVSASAAALAQAIKRRGFDRAARRPTVVRPDLVHHVEMRLAARCSDTIGLGRRAGIALAGYEKVSATLKVQTPGAVLLASDAAIWARKKLTAAANGASLINVLTSTELGQIFGREKVVHAMIGPGALAERLKVDAARLAGVRPHDVSSVAVDEDGV